VGGVREAVEGLVNAYILEACRTPVGRHGGALAFVRPDDLAAVTVHAVVERAGVEPGAIDDVILGCANGAGEDNRNVARMAALLAGLPVTVPGQTVNRLCGSGLQAVVSGGARGARRRGRPVRGRRRGEHVARAMGHVEAGAGVRARRSPRPPTRCSAGGS
jgi:hypothetical protein